MKVKVSMAKTQRKTLMTQCLLITLLLAKGVAGFVYCLPHIHYQWGKALVDYIVILFSLCHVSKLAFIVVFITSY